MYQLMVSHNCGINYAPDQEAETLEELASRMAELDENMLHWYLMKDGEKDFERVCSIHIGLTFSDISRL